MAHKSLDYVENEHPSFTGTGEYVDSGMTTPTARLSITTALATGDTCWYVAIGRDSSGNDVEGIEVGLGTKSSTGLARTTILASSNAGAAVDWATAAVVAVMITAPASRIVQLNNELTMALPAVAALPAAAAADTIKVYGRKVAGRMSLKYIGPSGVDQVVQDKISENGQVFYLPNNGTTVGLNYGLAWTSGGTVSHPTPSSTAPAIYSQQKRTRWANVVTTTNQTLGVRTATAEKRFWRGNAAGLGGFNFHCRFAVGLWPAASVRLFVGLNDANTGWVASDTLTGNGCGLWHDTTEAASVLNFVTRNGTTATKAAITLAANLAAGQCFDFWMWSEPNGSVIGYKLVELNTGTTLVDTTTSTTIPLNTAFIGPEMMMSNGTANTTVTTTAMEVSSMSCQSDS